MIHTCFHIHLRGIYDNICMFRNFIRAGNSCKLRNFSFPRSLIQSFYIPLFTLFNGSADINFPKTVSDNLFCILAIMPVRRNKCGNHDQACIIHQLCNLCNPPDIFYPVLIGKTKIAV